MPIVSDKKKLTKEEKEKFDELRNKTRALIVELGEIELTQIQLNQRHKVAKDYFDQMVSDEEEYSNQLTEKYGKINIDPETGEFTQIE